MLFWYIEKKKLFITVEKIICPSEKNNLFQQKVNGKSLIPGATLSVQRCSI